MPIMAIKLTQTDEKKRPVNVYRPLFTVVLTDYLAGTVPMRWVSDCLGSLNKLA